MTTTTAAPDAANETREREFHDEAFSRNVRQKAWKFYAVTLASRAFYARVVSARASGANALDLGCGRGANSLFLWRHGASVTSIDISNVALTSSRAKIVAQGYLGGRFAAMNAESLALATSSFDLVCGKAVLHHLDLDRALAEIARTMKPRGIGIFLEPLGHNPAINFYRDRTPDFRTPDEHPLHWEDLATFRRYFGRVETRCFTLLPLFAVPFRHLPGFESVVRGLSFMDDLVFRALPYLGRYAWQVLLVLSDPIKR
jgi:SAM-dependent methyltransferase